MIYLLSATVEDLPPPAGPMPEPAPDQIGDFYVRLGMVLAAWQFVESTLAMIYAAAIGSQNYDALTASFHTPANFKTRLDMVREAVRRSGFDEDLISEWKGLYNKTSRKSKLRNKVAHSIVMYEPKQRDRNRQLFMCPSVVDPTRFDFSFPQSDVITQKELDEMIQSFERLRSDLMTFFRKLPPAVRSQAASP